MGIVLVILSAISFSLSAVFGKIVTSNWDVAGSIVSIGRFSLTGIIMLIFMIMAKKSFKAKNFKPIFMRGIFSALAIISYFVSFEYTTITKANMLHMLYPGFIILLTPMVLKEKVDRSKYIYMALMLFAAYIIVNPTFDSINLGDSLAFFSAIASSFSVMALTLARKKDDTYLVIFYVMLIGFFINLPFVYNDLSSVPMDAIPLILLASIFGTLGQITMTLGYKMVDSSTGALISSNRIVITTIIGVVFLSEPMNFRIITAITITTLCLIGISGYFQKRFGLRKRELKTDVMGE
ncbi:DMT family transporter [Gudongella sp. DL1XJH-153]|uniref:DMT family transporter n=1 Tax=Gudongella sp. DL1XJH-153 TaxID=3409804 RepID=UPI003BB4AAB1